MQFGKIKCMLDLAIEMRNVSSEPALEILLILF